MSDMSEGVAVEVVGDEGGWRCEGHVAAAAFIAALEAECGWTASPSAVAHYWQRFVPIRGEPSDRASIEHYYDEARHGYWVDCKPGRGAHPYTWLDDTQATRLEAGVGDG